jgi:hypothetical protein
MSDPIETEVEALKNFILARLNVGSEIADISAALNNTELFEADQLSGEAQSLGDLHELIYGFATAIIADNPVDGIEIDVSQALEDIAYGVRVKAMEEPEDQKETVH